MNNPTQDEQTAWNKVLTDGKNAEGAGNLTFFIVQSERGGNLETFHFQAYAEFSKAVAWSAVKAIFGQRIHIENSQGSAAANIRYCTKNDTRVTGEALCVQGQWGKPKQKGGLMMLAISVQNGATLEDLDTVNPDLVLLHGKKIEAYMARQKGQRTTAPKIVILTGTTGCGKSQHCMAVYGVNAYWVAPPANGTVWFGHYVGQDVCIFDDFHSGWFSLTHLLRLMDSTPMYVAPKGDQVPFNSGTLVFTSNVDPRNWYKHYVENAKVKQTAKLHKKALERRIQDFAEIYDVTKEEVATPRGKALISVRRKRGGTFKFRRELNFSTQH